LQLPQVNVAELGQLTSAEDRKNFVGNAIYPIIDQRLGPDFAGRITGMLIDENLVNFN